MAEVSHGTIFDYDGFTADVEDVPSNWYPPFSHVVDPMILVCVLKREGAGYYAKLKEEHEALIAKGTNR